MSEEKKIGIDCYFCKTRYLRSRGYFSLGSDLHFNINSLCIFFHLIVGNIFMQPEIPFLPVVSSMKRLMRYSLGSVAIGCLLVSFVESIRFILESIRRKLKVANVVPDSHIGR